MDNFTAQSVKEVFGTEFQQYCLRRKILLQADKCGAFLAPNTNTLRECMQVLKGFKFRIYRRLKNLQRLTLSINYKKTDVSRLHRQYKNNKMKRKKFFRKITHDRSFLDDIEVKIYLCNSPSVLPSYKHGTAATDHVLNAAKSGNEIYDFIINQTMKNVTIVDYEASVPLISSLLEQFQKKYKRFHYLSALKHLINEQKSSENLKCKYAVTKKQLKLFFNAIFFNVVPPKMFGKLKNLQKVKKTMYHVLNEPCFKFFNLKPLIEKLDIASITWLKNIESIRIKWFVLAKFVKWFFVGFLFKILNTYFHMTASGTNNERLYIMFLKWNGIQRKFIEKRIRSNALQPDIECNEWSPSIGVYKLLPKSSNVRPIFRPQCLDDDKDHLYIMLKFLKQLHVTKYGLTNFEKRWKSIVQYKRNSEAKQLHLVACDVVDAFGSIIQEKLYNIIASLCEDLPENLILKYYVVKSQRLKDTDICYRQYFSDPNLLLPFAPGTLYAHTNHKNCQWIQKSWLLEKISKCIFYQRARIKEKTYIIGKGLVQGTMLSPILSDIYYNFILHKEMENFLKNGEIIKYMDDVLYVTENITFAEQFLQLIKKGIPQYNCYFKAVKTQTNVAYDGNTVMDNIIYIGYRINCTTLELEPKYSDTDLRYLISFSSKEKLTPIELLRNRLNNAAALKLSKIIFDNKVNSKKTIIKILKELCLVQAKRACILIKELFDNVQKDIKDILEIIKSSNERIARNIIRFFLIFQERMSRLSVHKWNNKILHFLWLTYRNVFLKDRILKQYFVRFFHDIV